MHDTNITNTTARRARVIPDDGVTNAATVVAETHRERPTRRLSAARVPVRWPVHRSERQGIARSPSLLGEGADICDHVLNLIVGKGLDRLHFAFALGDDLV